MNQKENEPVSFLVSKTRTIDELAGSNPLRMMFHIPGITRIGSPNHIKPSCLVHNLSTPTTHPVFRYGIAQIPFHLLPALRTWGLFHQGKLEHSLI